MANDWIPKISTTQTSTVVLAEQDLPGAMTDGCHYVFISNTNCWIKQGAAPVAAVVGAAGSMYVPANLPVLLRGADGANLSVLRDTADGKCSLTQISRTPW